MRWWRRGGNTSDNINTIVAITKLLQKLCRICFCFCFLDGLSTSLVVLQAFACVCCDGSSIGFILLLYY